MESCDVLVVGGGPAGSTCARVLAEGGLRVKILERDRFPREKPCAGWITPAVLRTLKIDPQQYREKHLLQGIREFRTGLMYRTEVVVNYARTMSYGIIRSEFDDYLLKQAKAEAVLGEGVERLEQAADGWVVNGRIKASLLIGAGGNNCPVARALGARPGKEGAIVAMVAEFEMGGEQLRNQRLPAGSVALHFTPDLQGYGWLFRKGNYLNVGLGSLESRDIRAQAEAYCAHLQKRGELLENVVSRLKGHAYLPYRKQRGRTLIADRALLIGDAAGLSFPESGEGILPAVESALLAARTVRGASGDYRREKLEPYADAIADRFGAGPSLSLPAAVKELAGRAILGNRWLTRHLVLDRWFLHRHHEPLAPEGPPHPPLLQLAPPELP